MLDNTWGPRFFSIPRLVVGLMFLLHGTAKLFGWPPGGTPANVPLFSLYGAAGIIEFVGGSLVAIGLFARVAAFIASGEMAFAYFLAHAPHSFFPTLNRGEGAIFYCFFFFYVFLVGAGPWSIDRWFRRV